MSFPAQHRAKLHSTNPLEGVNGEIKRRTEVVGIFPNEEAITRLVGAILLERNDEWAVQRGRYMTLETIAHWAMIPPSASGNRQLTAWWPAPRYTTPGDTIITRPTGKCGFPSWFGIAATSGR
jgi:hypothetical protein